MPSVFPNQCHCLHNATTWPCSPSHSLCSQFWHPSHFPLTLVPWLSLDCTTWLHHVTSLPLHHILAALAPCLPSIPFLVCTYSFLVFLYINKSNSGAMVHEQALRKLARLLHKGMDIWVVKVSWLFMSRARKGEITILLFNIVWVYHRSLERIVEHDVLQNKDGCKHFRLDKER